MPTAAMSAGDFIPEWQLQQWRWQQENLVDQSFLSSVKTAEGLKRLAELLGVTIVTAEQKQEDESPKFGELGNRELDI